MQVAVDELRTRPKSASPTFPQTQMRREDGVVMIRTASGHTVQFSEDDFAAAVDLLGLTKQSGSLSTAAQH